MSFRRLRLPALLLASTLGLSACAYDNYGYGYASVGYGGGYCDPYYDDCYGGGGGYYGDPWYGWYGNYYYPGFGIYVYDQYRRPHRWNDHQRVYWESRRSRWGDRNWNDRRWERWDGWDRRDGAGSRQASDRRGDGNWRDGRRSEGRRGEGRRGEGDWRYGPRTEDNWSSERDRRWRDDRRRRYNTRNNR